MSTRVSLLWVVVLSCGVLPPVAEPTSVGQQPLGAVRTEKECAFGVGRNKCLRVEPVKPPVTPRIDGAMSEGEYVMATDVEFANVAERVSGRLTFSIDEERRRLRIFAKDLPMPLSSNKVVLLLDFNRFAAGDFVDGDDWGLEYDVATGRSTGLVPSGAGLATTWVPTSGGLSYLVRADNVRVAPGGQRRVDLELQVSMKKFDAVGVMLATNLGSPLVNTGAGLGVFPDDVGVLGHSDEWTFANSPFVQRDQFQTLVFRTLPGRALTFMTWNAKRFTPLMQTTEDLANLASAGLLDTSDLTDQEIGTFIGQQGADVVALEELFRAEGAKAIADAANQVRLANGLPPYEVVGSSDLAPSILQSLPGDVSLRPDETNGGVYLLSARRVIRTGYRVYDTCKGEDCFKAKGVVWARVSTDPPEAFEPCDEGLPCPMPASGDHFVDVFATHLNGPTPLVCVFPEVGAAYAATWGSAGGAWGGVIAAASMNCFASTDTVLHDQVAQLSAYVDAVADPSRAAIVMGDFNIDGKYPTLSGYADLLHTLKVGPLTDDPANAAADDVLNLWPDAYSTDLDHGDVARERGSEWASGDGTDLRATGTYNDDGTHRFDYIFVRNPVDRSAITAANTRQIVRRQAGGKPWVSPWPGPADQSSRLSDHRPVLSQLEFVPLVIPNRFHRDWEQTIELRVTSYDTTGLSDCWGCGPLDVYTKNWASRMAGGVNTQFKDADLSAECSDKWAAAFGQDGCMANWYWNDYRLAAVDEHHVRLELWDRDTIGRDERYQYFDWTDDPHYVFTWARASLDVQDLPKMKTHRDWLHFEDSFPQGRCTRTSRANVCLQLSFIVPTPY